MVHMKTVTGMSSIYLQILTYEPHHRHRHGRHWIPEPVSACCKVDKVLMDRFFFRPADQRGVDPATLSEGEM